MQGSFNPVDLSKIRSTHGSLVYKLHKLEEHSDAEHLKRVNAFLTELEKIHEEMAANEELIPFSEASEFEDSLCQGYHDVRSNEQHFSAFHMTVPTRWMFDRKMLESYLRNIGKKKFEL